MALLNTLLFRQFNSSDLEEAIKVHEQTLGELKGNIVYVESWEEVCVSYKRK